MCGVDNVIAASPTSECPLLDSDRDTTFDDFDLENDERLEVTEMFHSSSSRQGRYPSDSDIVLSAMDDSSLFNIDIPSSFRLLTKIVLLSHFKAGLIKIRYYAPPWGH